MTFKELQLIEPLLRSLDKAGYQTPTPIQEQAIPILLKGYDLLGCAQTGTGKTAAFSLPILQQLYNEKEAASLENREFVGKKKSYNPRTIRSLIVTPTRELAIQIEDSFKVYGKYTGIRTAVIFGGVSQHSQELALKSGVQVLIATPGRLLDLHSQGLISLAHLEHFVLDEADRMLDMGFIGDIKKILKLIPTKRQTLFFSATMPAEIEKLANTMLTNPMKVEVTPESSTVDTIEDSVYFVSRESKKGLLLSILADKESNFESVLIFTRTKHGADKLVKILKSVEIFAEAIHGNKSQNARQKALDNFKSKRSRVLVATDIAARGIDISGLSLVINYELPNISETYVHRIGRTGRAGNSGVAKSFCEPEEVPYLRDIQKLIGRKIPVVADHPFLDSNSSNEIVAKNKELDNKAKAKNVYRGSKANGEFWRRQKRNK